MNASQFHRVQVNILVAANESIQHIYFRLLIYV